MDKQTFARATKHAIEEANLTRRSLATTQALQFLSDSAQFDPRVLQRLGSVALGTFLSTIQKQGIAFEQSTSPTADSQSNPVNTSATATGWSAQRCKEPAWWLRAITRGTLAGLGWVLIGTLTLALLNY